MSIVLYDLTGADPAIRFSPYCWRTKLALKHKGLDYETVPWRFTDKAAIAPTEQPRVPVIVDGGKWVADSWAIALYLDEAYPARPRLFPDAGARAHARFINSWCDWSVLPGSRPLSVPNVFKLIAEQDKVYFRQTREKMLGMPIEEFGADRAAAFKTFRDALKPAEVTLGDHAYLHGAEPGYGDIALFGSLLWPYVVCEQDPIDRASPIGKWFERMLALNGGWVGNAPTARAR